MFTWEVSLVLPDHGKQTYTYNGPDFLIAGDKVHELLSTAARGVQASFDVYRQMTVSFWNSSQVKVCHCRPFRFDVVDTRFEDGFICTIELKQIKPQAQQLEFA